MRIAVVGGGAAAVSLVDSMLARADQFSTELSVCIYEPAALARGYSFGPDLECARINLPNARMSIRDTEPSHFVEWLRRQPGTAQLPGDMTADDGFAPRRLFGNYLASHFAACRAAAAGKGWRLTVHAETVLDVAAADDGTAAVATAEARRDYSHVVLCLGPGSPADPFQLTGTPGFHPNPYPLRTVLPRIEPQHSVLIIGTGLTAVDAALGLIQLGHQGPITMASRRGVLPGVLAPEWRRPLMQVTAETVAALAAIPPRLRSAEVLRLLRAELVGAGLDPVREISWLRSGISAAEYLRHQLGHQAVSPIQSIFMGVSRQLAAAIRAALPEAERQRVLAEFRPQLKSLQCPMPPLTARRLLGVMDAGQLTVTAGLTSIRRRHDRFEATAAHRVPEADQVIDATRTTPAATTGRGRSLVDALTARGYASWDAYSGLSTDPATGRLRGAPRCLFAIGEITAGDVYYGSSLPAVNRGADAVADALAEDYTRRHRRTFVVRSR